MGRFTTVDPHASNYYPYSSYSYSSNNPTRFIDPDGKDWWDAVVGSAIGLVTNIIPGSTGLRGTYSPTDASHYNNALRTSDATAMAVGEIMTITGTGAAAAGGTVATAGAAVTVVSGGTLAIAGAPAAAAGAAVAGAGIATAAGGMVLMSNSTNNSEAGYDYGNEKTSEKGSRATEGDDGNEQLDGLQQYQKDATKSRPSTKEEGGEWEGSRRPKQHKAFNDGKSEQRSNYQNKRKEVNDESEY